MNNIGAKLHKDKFEILNFCSRFNKIYIYGAGSVARLLLRYFEEESIQIDGLIVSSLSNNKKIISGVQIYSFDDVLLDEFCGVIVGVRFKLQSEIKKKLLSVGIKERQIYCQKIYGQYIDNYEKIYSSTWKESEQGYFSSYQELNKFGIKYGTDKSSTHHNYLNKYEFFLERWRNKNIVLLELGVLKGGSINTWSEYFKNGEIYGIDINENCRRFEDGNRHIIIQDLGDEDGLEKLADLKPNIIVDDASHYWSHQIKSLYHLLPAMKSGGVFIIEDLNTSHAVQRLNGYDDSIVSGYELCEALALAVNSGTYLDDRNLKSPLICLKEEIAFLASQIEMISFIHDCCIIIKK